MKTIIEMAREAGFAVNASNDPNSPRFKALAALVRADEREECAKVCDDAADNVGPIEFDIGASLAAAIRARGNT